MKIVVLDGYTLNPGDLDWSPLQKLGELQVFERTTPQRVVERSAGANVIFTNKTPITAGDIAALPDLRFIGVLATGFNIVDVEAARERNIPVANVPGYSSASVAQLTFALLLEFCHRVQRHSDAVTTGRWSSSLDFSFWDSPLIELQGKTIGIIGYGDIGSQVGVLARAFGMKVMAHQRTMKGRENEHDFRWAELADLLQQSDVVSIHCPLTPQTKEMVNESFLRQMKPDAFLINTSRGPLVADQDLADALNNGVIAGAALDVLTTEPPDSANPLLKARNCIITPHIAWATLEARRRLLGITVQNLQAFINGKPQNIVNP